MLSRSIFLITVICTVFMGNSPSVASEANAAPDQNDATQTYANEVEIVFENDGQKVQAFEGSIQAPENRSDKNSRLIPLHYLRFPATGKNPGLPHHLFGRRTGRVGNLDSELSGFPFSPVYGPS